MTTDNQRKMSKPGPPYSCKSICSVLDEDVVLHSTCIYRFRRFKAGYFDVNDRQRSGTPQTSMTDALKSLLDENLSQTQKGLAEQELRKWLPPELPDDSVGYQLNTCVSLLVGQRINNCLWKIVTDDEKWIIQSTTSTAKPNTHAKKVLLCIWSGTKGVLFYELFQPAGQRFRDAAEVRKWIDDFIASKPMSFFHEEIRKLPVRWQKVIESEEKYFDGLTMLIDRTFTSLL
uniref:DH domain-containing protein n=1 Tax=Heterorhabditis bacteriophora TaxID=37862 RepID=A0A1I7X5C0_HETBA